MAAYSYRALATDGSVAKGVLEGDSERQVRNQLRAQSLRPLEVKAARHAANGPSEANIQTVKTNKLLRRGSRLKTADLSLFTRQLATLIQSGLPLTDALQACAKQSRKARVQEVIVQIRSRVQEGHSLAYALGEFPRSFDELYRATIEAGESAGFLGPVLVRLAEYCESGQSTTQQLRSAMIYPVILMVVAIAVIAGLMHFVVPNLVGMFARNDRELPMLTEALIAASDFVSHYGGYCFLAIVGLIILARWWLGKRHNRLRWHRLLLKLPVIGDWQRSLNSARFAATLAILSASGVPLLQALRIAQQVMTNLAMRDDCEAVVQQVSEGTALNVAMAKADIFPPLLVQMVASGELSGELAELLGRAAENQERELAHSLAALMAVIPPLMVVVMGSVVGVIVMAVLLPIFELGNLIN